MPRRAELYEIGLSKDFLDRIDKETGGIDNFVGGIDSPEPMAGRLINGPEPVEVQEFSDAALKSCESASTEAGD